MINRRHFLAVTLGVVLAGPSLASSATAGVKKRVKRRIRRKVRRRIRRRFRRRVAWRMFGGKRRLVVPVALVVGWELNIEKRVVVVHEIRKGPVEIVVVKTVVAGSFENTETSGSDALEEIEVHREDTPENTKDEQGSQLPDDDKTTPAKETEEEVEEEVDEE